MLLASGQSCYDSAVMPRNDLSLRTIFLTALLLVSAIVSFAQTPANDAYEDQQRAIRVLQFDKDIGTLPDPEIRALLRFNVLEFVYAKQVVSQYMAAEPVLAAFFEDMRLNEKDPGLSVGHLKIRLATLLRKNYPELAEIVEKKYGANADQFEDYLESVRRGGDPVAVIDRAIERIRAEEPMISVLNLYDSVRRTHPELGARLLSVAIEAAEKKPSIDNAAILDRLIFDVLNPPASEVSPELVARFHKVLVVAARSELARAHPKGEYVRTAWPLRRAIVRMQNTDPRLAAEARAIFANYRKFQSKEQVAKEEADDRIEAAPDKLARAISEAENASDPNLKDYLWMRAAQIALPEKRDGSRKPAVDLLMKAGPTLGTPDDPKRRDQWLKNIAYWGSAFRDHEGARYALDHVKDDQIRLEGMLEYVNELGLWEVKDRLKIAALADETIKQIEQLPVPPRRAICGIGNLRILMTGLTAYTNIGDLTARTVKVINRMPLDGSDAKAGTPERTQFYYLSRDMITCSGYVFRPVLNSSPAPPPELADGIKVKEWRIAAQIEAEKQRRYTPIP